MQLLSLNNISLKYGEKPLLKNINLMISSKERVCLVGRNGAGKSSLLNIIQQNIEPDIGEIVYKDNLRIFVVNLGGVGETLAPIFWCI